MVSCMVKGCTHTAKVHKLTLHLCKQHADQIATCEDKCPKCNRWRLAQQLNRNYFHCLYCGATYKLFLYRGRKGYEAVG